LRLYRQCWEWFWKWALDVGLEPDPAVVTTRDVNAFVDKQVASGVAPSTVSIRWRNLRPFFAWWSRETQQPNPFVGADVPGKGDEGPIPVIDLDDIRKLLATCSGRDFTSRRDEAIIRVLFDTGCRLGELLALELADWDRKNDFLTLRGKTHAAGAGFAVDW
jgi:site-specific recombinase XerD